MATVFGALYISLLSFIIRLGHAGPDVPAAAPLSVLGAERGWILMLAARGLGLRHRRIPRRHGPSAGRKFLTHISPSKTVEGVVGGVVASTIVVAADAVGRSARTRSTPSPSGR